MRFFPLVLAATLLLPSGCQKGAPKAPDAAPAARGPVPESWYLLPERGQASSPGALDMLGAQVDHLFAAEAAALPVPSTPPAPAAMAGTSPPDEHPVDWVPWRLAVVSADFALTTDGVFGALLGEGTADVQANWVRRDSLPQLARFTSPQHSRKATALLIHGTATPEDVARQLEPVIQASLASGVIRNESRFRTNLRSAAESFRLTAAQLDQLGDLGTRFPMSAFRLEMSFGAEGQVSPVIGVGGAVNLRFDWIVTDRKNSLVASGGARLPHTPLGDGLVKLVKGLAPDVDAAVRDASPVLKSGYALSSVRVGVGMSAEGTVGLVQGSAEAIGSVIFGDNDEEGGCLDPDGDGDCHNHHETALAAAALELPDDGIPFLAPTARPSDLKLAEVNGVAAVAPRQAAGEGGLVFRIPHEKFRAGMRKAITIGSFFTKHAAAVKGNWVIKELETEFGLSLTGTTGLVTLTGTGELELEFEHKGI